MRRSQLHSPEQIRRADLQRSREIAGHADEVMRYMQTDNLSVDRAILEVFRHTGIANQSLAAQKNIAGKIKAEIELRNGEQSVAK